MRTIKILDCTLRDGGYINEWKFGSKNIKNIIEKLNESNIDIIECGFLQENLEIFDKDYSIYSKIEDILTCGSNLFKENKTYALMMLTEKCNVDNLEKRNQNYISTIRLSFHKRDLNKAINDAKIIKEKGYELFLQPTATMRYNEEEIIELIKICNKEIRPNSIAVVDTFGEMLSDDITRYTKIFDKYLDKDIALSFHSHNNLQMAYSNALLFIENTSKDREIIIDSSIYGMGRGAGNLCSELIIDYLNKKFNKNYQLYPILEVADNILTNIRKQKYWGYSLEYYLSAIYHCHPNYCIFFSNKKTLTTSDLQLLVESISEDKKIDFDNNYATELYYSYFNKNYNDSKSYEKLDNIIGTKKVLLLGPGKTLETNKDLINDLINRKNEYFVISINNYVNYNVDAYFISNRKRYCDIPLNNNIFYFFTSNIDDDFVDENKKIIFDYNKVLAREIIVSDNSLLLFLNILKKIYKKEILLAGFDGYDHNQDKNYCKKDLVYLIDKNKVDELNRILKEYINLYKKKLDIKFLTPSKYNDKQVESEVKD